MSIRFLVLRWFVRSFFINSKLSYLQNIYNCQGFPYRNKYMEIIQYKLVS